MPLLPGSSLAPTSSLRLPRFPRGGKGAFRLREKVDCAARHACGASGCRGYRKGKPGGGWRERLELDGNRAWGLGTKHRT